MHKRTTIASLVLGVFALAGCAGPSPVRVEPTVRVTHGGTGAEAILEAGRYLLAERRYAAAVDVYRALLRASPNHPHARSGLGVAYAGLGQYTAATEAFQSGIRDAPDKTYLYNNLGYVLMLQGLYHEALAVLQAAERLDPQDRKVQENLAAARTRLATTVTTLPGGTERSGHEDQSGRTLPASGKTGGQDSTGISLDAPAVQAEFVPVSPSIFILSRSDRARAASLPELPGAAPMLSGPGPTVHIAGVAATSDALTRGFPEAPAEAPRERRTTSEEVSTPTAAAMPGLMRLDSPAESHSLKAGPAATSGVSMPVSAGQFWIEVSNGNGIAGLAYRTAAYLKMQGVAQPTRLTNHATFRQGQTEIQYREGFRAAAEGLQKRLGETTAVLRQSESLRTGTDVRLLLGRDFGDRRIKLAHAG